MKNPLVFPLMILAAALVLLVVTILMTPEVEVVQQPTFEKIVESARQGGASSAQAPSGPSGSATPEPQDAGAGAAEPTPAPEILAADAP
jgi:hypothetical protein